jgi:thymidylate synthase ThyX
MEYYETFSETQLKILERFVTNTTSPIFVLRNLPEVIKGALFSRYSRSALGLRSLLLKEFILNEEVAFSSLVGTHSFEEQIIAIQKAQSFYDRILDGYGDDSIGELGGAHLALEGISMLSAKVVEDGRIGASPLEKSTRYIYFDQKIDGRYLYYREPILMTSAYRDLFLTTSDSLFETYSRLIPPLTALLEQQHPKDSSISKGAYTATLRAKVLDCLRGLLPAGTLTNMGIFGNGRFFENLLQKMNCHPLAEVQEVGKKAYEELSKEIPSFIRRAEPSHVHYQHYAKFYETMQRELQQFAKRIPPSVSALTQSGVRLISFDADAPKKIAAALLFSSGSASLEELQKFCSSLSEEELMQLLDTACNARDNRRHKSPRALEHASFTFEILADFGIYRDLHRHRILTQERQLLTCDLGYYVPGEIRNTPLYSDYCNALEKAKATYDMIAKELPEEAQYIVPMAYNIHWYFHCNLRSLQWLCELRSSPQGHPGYRLIAQEMARQVSTKCPLLERFFKFVDYEGYDLGRLDAELRTEEKRKKQHLDVST